MNRKFAIGPLSIDSDTEDFITGVYEESIEVELRVDATNPNIIPTLLELSKIKKPITSATLLMRSGNKRYEYDIAKKFIKCITKEQIDYWSSSDMFGPYSNAKMVESREHSSNVDDGVKFSDSTGLVKIRASFMDKGVNYDFTSHIKYSDYKKKDVLSQLITHPVQFEMEFNDKLGLNLVEKFKTLYFDAFKNPNISIASYIPDPFNVVDKILKINMWFIGLNIMRTERMVRGNMMNYMNKAKDMNRLTQMSPSALVLAKSDGERAVMIYNGGNIIYSTQTKNIYYKNEREKYVQRFVIDGELITLGDTFVFLAFDVVTRQNLNYLERLSMLKEFFETTKLYGDVSVAVKNPIILSELKEHNPVEHAASSITVVYSADTIDLSIIENDGLIIVNNPEEKGYLATENLKWKPINTMDLLYKDGLLYATKSMTTSNVAFEINKVPITPYVSAFIPDSYKYNGKEPVQNMNVYEMEYLPMEKMWKVLKHRVDKIFPNNFLTCENIMYHTLYPITFEELIHPMKRYFNKYQKNDEVTQMREINNAIKSDLYTKYMKDAECLIDIGAGKGQDLLKYYGNNIKKVYMVENDIIAIYESILMRHYKTSLSNSQVVSVRYDINSELYPSTLKPCQNIVCNFALHYFETDAKIVNFLSKYWLKGGHFIFTVFDGVALREKLTKMGGNWEIGGMNIRLLSPTSIAIKLPFSQNEEYIERLIDIDGLVTNIKKTIKGSQLVEIGKHSSEKLNTLKEFNEFYRFVVLKY